MAFLVISLTAIFAGTASASHQRAGPGEVIFRVDTERFVDVRTIVVDSVGRTVMIISRGTALRTTELRRFKVNGQLDETFGDGGVLLFASEGLVDPEDGSRIAPVDLVIDESGRFVMVSGSRVVRLTPTGALDKTFGGTGVVHVEFSFFPPSFRKLVLDRGTIVAAGSWLRDFAAVRIFDDGTIDQSFGAEGLAQVPVADNPFHSESVSFVAVQPDGRIVLGGNYQGSDSVLQMAIVGLTSTGARDIAFGNDGVVLLTAQQPTGPIVQAEITGLDILRDGRIAVVTPIDRVEPGLRGDRA